MTNSSSESSISLRPSSPDDREAVRALLAATGVFRAEELEVALEVFDGCVDGLGYLGAVAVSAGRVVGIALWGPSPMTLGTFDLYWLASHPEAHGSGAASALLSRVVDDVHRRGGRLLIVETESTAGYARARRFYEREGLHEIARIQDYYRPGADKVVGAMRIPRER